MGSTIRPSVFNDRVAAALRDWHETAIQHGREGRHSDGASRSATPSSGMSPAHLLQSYDSQTTPDMSPMVSNFDNERWYGEGSRASVKKDDDEPGRTEDFESRKPGRAGQDSTPIGPGPIQTQHEINISSSNFSFRKSPKP